MKIILSRKGFDASSGKAPSPIFPSGAQHSLPIPEPTATTPQVCYAEIKAGEHSLGKLVNDLTQGKILPATPAHLDPDLAPDSRPRPTNWKPLFGQAGAAEGHLQKAGVQAGDIFLFYGWFRQIEQVNAKFRYVQGAPDLHAIFGWLQIEQRLAVANRAVIPTWALDHPHCRRQPHKLDALYIATNALALPNLSAHKPGGGVFNYFDPALRLTAPGAAKRSIWQLPAWFYPAERRSCLSYHHASKRWTPMGEHVQLQNVGRGQEFILDCDDYPEAIDWLGSLLQVEQPRHP
jgi:hypothetical protein